jgi:hypothetical protein
MDLAKLIANSTPGRPLTDLWSVTLIYYGTNNSQFLINLLPLHHKIQNLYNQHESRDTTASFPFLTNFLSSSLTRGYTFFNPTTLIFTRPNSLKGSVSFLYELHDRENNLCMGVFMLHISLQLNEKYTLCGLWKITLAEFKPDSSRRIFVKPPPAEKFWTGRN